MSSDQGIMCQFFSVMEKFAFTAIDGSTGGRRDATPPSLFSSNSVYSAIFLYHWVDPAMLSNHSVNFKLFTGFLVQ